MSNKDDSATAKGCTLIVMVVIIIIMIACDVYSGVIFLVAGIFMIIIGCIIAVDSIDNKSKSNNESLESYYQSASDDHHIRLDEQGKPTKRVIRSEDDTKQDNHTYQKDAFNESADDDDDLDNDNYYGYDDDFDDDDLDDDYTFDDDYRDENPFVDKDLMLSSEEYRNGVAAILGLKKLIKRMSKNADFRKAVINQANDKDTFEKGYKQEDFLSTLNLLLAKDVIYCYEYLGLYTDMDLSVPEGQLLIPITMVLSDEKVVDYRTFKRYLLSMDPLAEGLRDTYEEMYKVYRDNNPVHVTLEGVDDFSLVILVKLMDCESLYLNELRQGFNKMAEAIAGAAGKNEHRSMMLESLRLRERDDCKELSAKTKRSSQEQSSSQVDQPIATMDDLSALIGLQQVKKEVTAMKNFIEVNRRREEAGMKTPPISYHCVFTGNPGTGKTTVARIVAGIYKELGILQKGHLVETDRSGLVAEYVGQTAVKTNKVIDSALDGVLFIDEAYSLVGAGNEDFGKEAIATLVKRMEDNRDRLVVILAGYEDEMQQFIESNPGLRSRFNRYIHFEDYTAEELEQIFLSMLQRYDYVLQDEGEQALRRHFEQCVANKGKDFGNARYVRNLFERSIKAQSVRLAAQTDNDKTQLATIIADDITSAIADKP